MSQTFSLHIFHHGRFVEKKTLAQDVIKIGKLKSSHLCLEDDAVARMHAVIESAGSDLRVIDLGSAAGTFLNGARVQKNAALGHGDSLSFGPFRVDVELMSAASAALASLGGASPAELAGLAPPSMATAAPYVAVAAAPAMPRVAGATALAPAVAPQVVAPRPATSPGIAAGECERDDGGRVAEVITTFHETVLDVQHVGQTRDRRKHAPLAFALGGVLFAAGAAMLGTEVAQDWEAYGQARADAAEAGQPAPEMPGHGLGGLGMIVMLLGLVPIGMGAVRMGERGMPSYRIGEGHDAQFHVPGDGLPDRDGFELIGSSSGGHVLQFLPGMRGDVTVDGRTLTLAELVATGHVGTSGSAYALALPAGARCRVEHGPLTFFVNEVLPGKRLATKAEADKPFWSYNAASLAVLGALLTMVHLVPDESMSMSLEDSAATSRYVGYITQADQITPEETVAEQEDSQDEAGGQGQRHTGDEGQMGKPTSKKTNGAYQVKGPRDAVPMMARNYDPNLDARNAGILGQLAQESGHFLASPYGGAFAVGNADSDVWGNVTGTAIGESFGLGGLGLVGTGRGGGGTGEGTIGAGNFGLMGNGGGGGTGLDYGRGSGTGFDTKKKRAPIVRATKADIRGDIDKDTIRRIVRNHMNEVRHCYNQGLVRDPNMRGRVAVQFSIGPTGKVVSAAVTESSLGDTNVGNCVAAAVKRWAFPRPVTGGTALVTYPFMFNPS